MFTSGTGVGSGGSGCSDGSGGSEQPTSTHETANAITRRGVDSAATTAARSGSTVPCPGGEEPLHLAHGLWVGAGLLVHVVVIDVHVRTLGRGAHVSTLGVQSWIRAVGI